jgi:RNA polymerase sigma-70 factor (ECF subfamily)
LISDEDLMIKSSKGDMKAFEQLVLRHQSPVWRTACRYIRNVEEARDITQKVFMKLFEISSRYEKRASFKTFLYHIVNTTCLDYIRKKRPLIFETLPEPPDDYPLQTDIIAASEKELTVKNALEKLPQRQRTAVTLRYDAELSIREIADILKTTEKAVERLLAHARSALHPALSKYFKN